MKFRHTFPVCLFAAALVLQSCATTSARSNPEPEPAPASSETTVVAVAQPKREALVRKATLNGELRPYQQVDLHAKIAGYLQKIHVDVGHFVKAGQLLAELEVPELQHEIAQAEARRNQVEAEQKRAAAAIERAKATVELTRTSHERLIAVNRKEKGLVAQQEIDEAAARLRSAEAELAVSQAALDAVGREREGARAAEERVKTMREYTRIVAPFAGVITKRYADPGAMIQAGTASHTGALPVVRLADVSRMRLVLSVPETSVSSLQPGQEAEVRVPALQKSFSARLARFTNNVQSNSRTMEVEIDVANARGELKAGMVADAVVNTGSRKDALTVPVQAISNAGGNRFVMVVNRDRVIEERQIVTGFEGTARMEVISGVTEDEPVVIGNRNLLRAGMKVEPKLEGAN
ncbi:MAG: efflux RND transporter periplasmic adaptor subunit [Bryobacterales bacterium]|nr:efflux RND transporter periplasmic adaptor subunit [Bryobacterales bacterium]